MAESDPRSIYLRVRQDALVVDTVTRFRDLWHCRDNPFEPSGTVYCPLSSPDKAGERHTALSLDGELVNVFQGVDSSDEVRERVQAEIETGLRNEGFSITRDPETGMKRLPLTEKPLHPAPPVVQKPKIFY